MKSLRFSRKRSVWTAVVVAAGCVLSQPWVGQWLVVNQRPVRSEAIMVLGGGPINRLKKAVQLYRDGFAPLLMVSGGAPYQSGETQAEKMAQQASFLGVPRSAILLENRSKTTYQNARDTKRLMLQHHLRSAIVVSSDYHMRRVEFLFGQVYQNTGVRLTFSAASDPAFRPARWWSNRQSMVITISEYIKLGINVVQVWWRQGPHQFVTLPIL